MKLYHSPASPFARKVRAVAIESGIKLDLITVETAAPELGKINPIQRVPALQLDDGSTLFDSPVICEYLDWSAKGKLYPSAGPARWKALKLQAMGDGIMDAAVPRRQETLRPKEQQSPTRLAAYERSMRQTLDALEAATGDLDGVSIGTIAIGCALGYLDFRFPSDEWRKGRPQLAAWFEAFAKRPSIEQTKPQ